MRTQLRRDVSVAVWVFFILALVFGVPFLIVQLTSKESAPPQVATPTETVASCAGEKPPDAVRSPGPFAPPTAQDVDASHIFVATIKTYCGNIVVKVDSTAAPDAVRSFVYLARKRFYNALAFDRILPNLAILGGGADPGFSFPARGPKAGARYDVLMYPTNGRISARFGIVNGPDAVIDGVKIGTILEDDAASRTVLARLMAQPSTGGAPSPPIHILHIEVQEFTRE